MLEFLYQPGARTVGTYGKIVRPTRSASIVCPKNWTKKWVRPHLEKIGVKLTKLSNKQADYLGVPVEGPEANPITIGINSSLVLTKANEEIHSPFLFIRS